MEERQLMWRKSSRSGTNGSCVEVAFSGDRALVRDTKNRGGGTLEVPTDEWAAFIDFVKREP